MSIAHLVIVWLGSMATRYRSGRLIGAGDRKLFPTTLERLPFRMPLQERHG